MKTFFSPVERTVLFCTMANTIVLKVSKQLQIAFEAAFLEELEEDICSRDSCGYSDNEIHGPSNSLIQQEFNWLEGLDNIEELRPFRRSDDPLDKGAMMVGRNQWHKDNNHPSANRADQHESLVVLQNPDRVQHWLLHGLLRTVAGRSSWKRNPPRRNPEAIEVYVAVCDNVCWR